MKTWAPALARAFAAARPIPLVPPVTNATLASSLGIPAPSNGSTFRLDDSCRHFPISEAFDEVVVHHSHCLHIGVNDRGTHEFESTAFQVFAQRIGFRRGGGNLLHDSPAVYLRLSTDKAPRVLIKTSELLLNREKRPRVAYSRLDFLPISNDPWIKQ